ncbi:MAG: hypothetical protein ACYC26_06855 [Phycisphaerales bacterium]
MRRNHSEPGRVAPATMDHGEITFDKFGERRGGTPRLTRPGSLDNRWLSCDTAR